MIKCPTFSCALQLYFCVRGNVPVKKKQNQTKLKMVPQSFLYMHILVLLRCRVFFSDLLLYITKPPSSPFVSSELFVLFWAESCLSERTCHKGGLLGFASTRGSFWYTFGSLHSGILEPLTITLRSTTGVMEKVIKKKQCFSLL